MVKHAGAIIAGAAIGTAIANSSRNAQQIAMIEKGIWDDVLSTYGAVVAADLYKQWLEAGKPVDIDIIDSAESIARSIIYQNIVSRYSERCADYYESRMEKAATKGIKLDLDKELLEFGLSNGVEFSTDKPFTQIAEEMKCHYYHDAQKIKKSIEELTNNDGLDIQTLLKVQWGMIKWMLPGLLIGLPLVIYSIDAKSLVLMIISVLLVLGTLLASLYVPVSVTRRAMERNKNKESNEKLLAELHKLE